MWNSYGADYGQAAKGMKFRRQHPIGQYIADFVCLERKLIIELDGGQHALPEEILKDRQRDIWLEEEGYAVMRFWDNEVLTNTSGVLEAIRQRLHRTPSPQSPPLKGGEEITRQNEKEPNSTIIPLGIKSII
jgi:very-short-patch-repair endonuclease